jgi:hypothetical protein
MKWGLTPERHKEHNGQGRDGQRRAYRRVYQQVAYGVMGRVHSVYMPFVAVAVFYNMEPASRTVMRDCVRGGPCKPNAVCVQ